MTEKLGGILPLTVWDLIPFLPEECVDAYDKMANLGNTNKRAIKAYASLFRLLPWDVSVDAIIPLCICDYALSFLETCATNQCISTILTEFPGKLSCFLSDFHGFYYAQLMAIPELMQYWSYFDAMWNLL